MRRIVLAVVCTSAFTAIPAFATDHVVIARNGPGGRHFDPSPVVIIAGDTVTFKNDIAGLGFHNVLSDNGAITPFRCADGCDGVGAGNGNASMAAWSATVTFPTAGSVGYYCEIHGGSGGAGMSGIVTINPAVATPTIDVSPGSVTGSAETGASTATGFTIANTGSATLDWTLDESTTAATCSTPSDIPWLVVDPLSGSIATGAAATNVDVTLDAASLTPGQYNANICVHSNDAAHNPLTVPVTFTVNTPDLIFEDGFDG